jgi:serine/threonine-protein kinase HipA
MDNEITFETFLAGQWCTVGSMSLLGNVEAGWKSRAYLGYAADYALEHIGKRDAAALSWTFPVGLQPLQANTWPGFIMDLLPQGYGRQELLRQLGLPASAETLADWALLRNGAANPVGNCRVREAFNWLQERSPQQVQGFTFAEVAQRGEAFTEYLAEHGLFVAGSSAVQGEWPKILLTEDASGQLFLDHALADDRARRHWLVKFARGQDVALNRILSLEAAWMALAQSLGLRVHGALRLEQRALFVPRFDRESTTAGLVRHAQESLYALCGCSGFGATLSHNTACRWLGQAATDPQAEILEYLKRDVANVVLGNKDNHGRNTAIQRRTDGWVGLTPVFDFAPMVFHPEGIARNMRWEQQDAGHPDWKAAATQAAEASGVALPPLLAGLRAMAEQVLQLPQQMQVLGIDEAVIQPFVPTMMAAVRKLRECTDG